MTKSRAEELILALWAIASILAFSGGYTSWGWVFAIKASLDFISTIYISIKELKEEIK